MQTTMCGILRRLAIKACRRVCSTIPLRASTKIKARFAVQKKDAVSKQLENINRFGSGFKSSVLYTRYNDTVFGLPQSGYSISISDVNLQDCQFSKDVFELYFRGNK